MKQDMSLKLVTIEGKISNFYIGKLSSKNRTCGFKTCFGQTF